MTETGSLFCGHDHKAQITLKKRHLFSRSAFERKRTTTICRYITIVAWTSLESKMEIKQATPEEADLVMEVVLVI